jgi:hypothetical protein
MYSCVDASKFHLRPAALLTRLAGFAGWLCFVSNEIKFRVSSNKKRSCWLWDYHTGDHVEYYLVECNYMRPYLPTFRVNVHLFLNIEAKYIPPKIVKLVPDYTTWYFRMQPTSSEPEISYRFWLRWRWPRIWRTGCRSLGTKKHVADAHSARYVRPIRTAPNNLS